MQPKKRPTFPTIGFHSPAKSEAFPSATYAKSRRVAAGERHSLWRTNHWLYTEKMPSVTKFSPMFSRRKHFVLVDKANHPRATLAFTYSKGKFAIKTIQPEKTQYEETEQKGTFKWAAWKEKMKTTELKKELDGTHPSEFLLFEFLRHYKSRIKSEDTVSIYVAPGNKFHHQHYGPLLDRFFKKAPSGEEGVYVLSFAKRRVREALELK